MTLNCTTIIVIAGILGSMCFGEEISDYINVNKQIIWTDGASYYKLASGGTFELSPAGISGRTILGHWEFDSNNQRIQIVGKWGWVNGYNIRNDFRSMAIDLRIPISVPDQKGITKPYFSIEEVKSMPVVQYLDWMRQHNYSDLHLDDK